MNREEAKEILQGVRITSFRPNGTVKVKEALALAIEALKILGDDGIVNCCGCIHWNEYGFCNLTDKHREDFDYCSDGRREP